MNFQFPINKRLLTGQAAIFGVLFVMAAMLAANLGTASISIKETRVAEENARSKRAYFTAEAGVEDAMYRLGSGKQTPPSISISLNNSVVTTSVVQAPTFTYTISGTGVAKNAYRAVVSQMTIEPGAQFGYALQVGFGGVEVGNSSTVNGSLYINGSLEAGVGDSFNGDVYVADPAFGGVEMGNSTTFNGILYSNGPIQMGISDHLNGNVYVAGTNAGITLGNSSDFGADIFSNGSIMGGLSNSVGGSVRIAGPHTLSGAASSPMTVAGNVFANSISNVRIQGDAYYQTIDSTSLNWLNAYAGSPGIAHPGSPDLPSQASGLPTGDIHLAGPPK